MADYEKLAQEAGLARVVNMAEQFLFPYLEKRIAQETEILSSTFRAGKSCENNVAFIAALVELRSEIDRIVRKGNSANAQLNNKL